MSEELQTSAKMIIFNRCLICQSEVYKRSLNNLKLCQKFITVASRYYNIHFPDNSVNLCKTLKLNQLKFDGDSADLASCDKCFPKINTFCEIYEEVSLLQIHLDASARKITELMTHSHNRNNGTPDFAMSDYFRNRFYSKVAQQFPHVKLRKLEIDDELRFQNDPLYIPIKIENSANEDGTEIAQINPNRSFTEPLTTKADFGGNPESRHKCRFCNKTFKTRKNKTSHENVHLQPHQCRFCNRKFSSRTVMKVHERTHTGIKPFKCSVCAETFRERRACRSHIWNVHKGNAEVIVEEESNIVEAKIESHVGQSNATRNSQEAEKPFKCPICLKGFTTRQYVTMHKKMHTKPFHCDICGARFQNNNVMENHRRTHTGERPFLCPICFQTFSQRQSCRIHQRNIHKIPNGDVINATDYGVKVVPLPNKHQTVTPGNQSEHEIEGTEHFQWTNNHNHNHSDNFILPDTQQKIQMDLKESEVIQVIVDTELVDPLGDVSKY